MENSNFQESEKKFSKLIFINDYMAKNKLEDSSNNKSDNSNLIESKKKNIRNYEKYLLISGNDIFFEFNNYCNMNGKYF